MPRALYSDRQEAGRVLAISVERELGRDVLATGMPLVLAIPRGGVPIGHEVAMALKAELDLVVPRKLGAQGNPEYGIGAVMHDGTLYLNPEALRITGTSRDYIEEVKAAEMREAARRLKAYRDARPAPIISGRLVVVVDDGIATGATMIVSLRWVRSRGAKVVVAAAPVAPPSTIQELRQEADHVVCPHAPEPFHAIGEFYDNFEQVSDERVREILRQHWGHTTGGPGRWSTKQ